MKHLIAEEHFNSIYDGVLGKTIAVYLGKPVEGWSYQMIRDQFNYINYFVHDTLNKSIVEPDDDISGTFSFLNAYPEIIEEKSSAVGNLWLNRVIENKSIFWWGGLYRSTEHTAYHNLKKGIKAPFSGSSALNGKIVSEQIGSQIFIDGWGLLFPSEPLLAYQYACEAAAVSHGGIAIVMAGFIAALESISFSQKDLDVAIDQVIKLIDDESLTSLIYEMKGVVKNNQSWRDTRDYIEMNHNYERYGGNCPIVTNFLVIISALLHEPNSYLDAVAISISMGWDTDCNAGNVGCIQAIRLGLHKEEDINLIERVNDQLYVADAMGDEVLSNATYVANNIIKLKNHVDYPLFSFNYPNSTQGFIVKGKGRIKNRSGEGLDFESQGPACLSVELFKLKDEIPLSGYDVMMLPKIYGNQKFIVKIESPKDEIIQMGYSYWNTSNTKVTYKDNYMIKKGLNSVELFIDHDKGMLVDSFFIEVETLQSWRIKSIELQGIPQIEIKSVREMSPDYVAGSKLPYWWQQFMDTTHYSTVDHLSSLCVSDTRENQFIYTGSRNMCNYQFETLLEFSKHKEAGIIFHMQGLRRYYKVSFHEMYIKVGLVYDNQYKEIIQIPHKLKAKEKIKGNIYTKCLELLVNGKKYTIELNQLECGYFGYLISEGTLQVHQLYIGEMNNEL